MTVLLRMCRLNQCMEGPCSHGSECAQIRTHRIAGHVHPDHVVGEKWLTEDQLEKMKKIVDKEERNNG